MDQTKHKSKTNNGDSSRAEQARRRQLLVVVILIVVGILVARVSKWPLEQQQNKRRRRRRGTPAKNRRLSEKKDCPAKRSKTKWIAVSPEELISKAATFGEGALPLWNGGNSLAPGELPGYTGWARPEATLARHLQLVGLESSSSSLGGDNDVLTLQLACREGASVDVTTSRESTSQAQYQKQQSLCSTNLTQQAPGFFVRAYGPSVVTGTVTLAEPWVQISFHLVDVGIYTVEVVVTFSTSPPPQLLPLPARHEAGYEGYLVPGFPLQVAVDSTATSATPFFGYCRDTDLLDSHANDTEILRKGRWKVIHMNRWPPPPVLLPGAMTLSNHDNATMEADEMEWETTLDRTVVVQNDEDEEEEEDEDDDESKGEDEEEDEREREGEYQAFTVSPHDYKSGRTSMGVQMKYQYNNECSLMEPTEVFRTKTTTMDENDASHEEQEEQEHILNQCLPDNTTRVHVIFIGDAVMRLVHDYFHSHFVPTVANVSHVRLSLIRTATRHVGLEDAWQNVTQTLQQYLGQDSAHNWTRRFVLWNSGVEDIEALCGSAVVVGRNETQPPCIPKYQTLMQRMVHFFETYPAERVVFRTTTAAWPKYGTFGILWPPQERQRYSHSPDWIQVMNEIAKTTILSLSSSSSLSSPRVEWMDAYWLSHARPDTAVSSRRSVHPGRQVVHVMTQQWFQLVLNQLCLPHVLQEWWRRRRREP